MRPKKTPSEWSTVPRTYSAVMQKLCAEEDVLIVPQFVSHHAGEEVVQFPPGKWKEEKSAEKQETVSTVLSESIREDPCDSLQPPQVQVVLGPDDQPVAVICRNMYIEFSLIHAIGKSLAYFPTITTLKIENCCISKMVAEALAYVLSEGPGKGITELSLNGNESIGEILPLFIYLPTGLKYLSVQNCNLDNEAMKFLSAALEFYDGRDLQLQVLNLGMNKIGDEGAWYLANALRTNRTLVSLSLMGNQIGGEGATYLAEILQEFRLTHREVMLRRRRIFDQILLRARLMGKYLAEWKLKGEPETPNAKSAGKPVVRKIRGADGKVRCYTSKERRGKLGKSEIGEKLGGKSRGGAEETQGPEPSPSQLALIEQQVDGELPPDKHPFVTEVTQLEDGFWCEGCWSLANLNLAYNYLTLNTLGEFDEVLQYHEENFHPRNTGLLRLVLLPEEYSGSASLELLEMSKTLDSASAEGKLKRVQEGKHEPSILKSNLLKPKDLAKVTKSLTIMDPPK